MILLSILVISIYYHPAQGLVQRYIPSDIIGCKRDTKTVSCYLLCYLVIIYLFLPLKKLEWSIHSFWDGFFCLKNFEYNTPLYIPWFSFLYNIFFQLFKWNVIHKAKKLLCSTIYAISGNVNKCLYSGLKESSLERITEHKESYFHYDLRSSK